MLESLRSFYRKVSFASAAAGLLMAFYTEAFADIPGKAGRPKPPIAQQRMIYLAVIGSGVPGVVWGGQAGVAGGAADAVGVGAAGRA